MAGPFFEMKIRTTLKGCTNLCLMGDFSDERIRFPMLLRCLCCGREIEDYFQVKPNEESDTIIQEAIDFERRLNPEDRVAPKEMEFLQQLVNEDGPRRVNSSLLRCDTPNCQQPIWTLIMGYGEPIQASYNENGEPLHSDELMYSLYVYGATPFHLPPSRDLFNKWRVERLPDRRAYTIDFGIYATYGMWEEHYTPHENDSLFPYAGPEGYVVLYAHVSIYFAGAS